MMCMIRGLWWRVRIVFGWKPPVQPPKAIDTAFVKQFEREVHEAFQRGQ